MNEKINIAEILKNHIGMEVYCSLMGECIVDSIEGDNRLDYPINLKHKASGRIESFSIYGTFNDSYPNAECVIFPSKDQRDWSKFKSNPKLEVHHDSDTSISISFGNDRYVHIYIYNGNLEGDMVVRGESTTLFDSIEI